MASKKLLTIALSTAYLSILMVALWPVPALALEQTPFGIPGVTGPSLNAGDIAQIEGGTAGSTGVSPAQPRDTGTGAMPRVPNYLCYTRCAARCPAPGAPLREQACDQSCVVGCGG